MFARILVLESFIACIPTGTDFCILGCAATGLELKE